MDEFLPFDDFLLRSLSDWLGRLEWELVVCDIALLGLAAAELTGLPSLLIEHFTWDWIYQSYRAEAPSLKRHADDLSVVFVKGRCHLKAEPFCVPSRRGDRRLSILSRRPWAAAGTCATAGPGEW